jgi:hypothetical protein
LGRLFISSYLAIFFLDNISECMQNIIRYLSGEAMVGKLGNVQPKFAGWKMRQIRRVRGVVQEVFKYHFWATVKYNGVWLRLLIPKANYAVLFPALEDTFRQVSSEEIFASFLRSKGITVHPGMPVWVDVEEQLGERVPIRWSFAPA